MPPNLYSKLWQFTDSSVEKTLALHTQEEAMYIRFNIVEKTSLENSAGFNLEILGCYDQGSKLTKLVYYFLQSIVKPKKHKRLFCTTPKVNDIFCWIPQKYSSKESDNYVDH